MAEKLEPRSSETHGRLWGARAQDWAEVLEPAEIDALVQYLVTLR